MKFAKILVIAGFSAACVTAAPSEDINEPPKLEQQDAQEPKKKPLPLPDKVRLRCEYGCPATMPFVNIMPVFNHPDACRAVDVVDTVDTTDAADVAATDAEPEEPDACGDVYDFGVCCGDGTCQPGETAFFCPKDCL